MPNLNDMLIEAVVAEAFGQSSTIEEAVHEIGDSIADADNTFNDVPVTHGDLETAGEKARGLLEELREFYEKAKVKYLTEPTDTKYVYRDFTVKVKIPADVCLEDCEIVVVELSASFTKDGKCMIVPEADVHVILGEIYED